MLENHFGLIEAAFVFGLTVAFYIWQMRDLAQADKRSKDEDDKRDGTGAT